MAKTAKPKETERVHDNLSGVSRPDLMVLASSRVRKRSVQSGTGDVCRTVLPSKQRGKASAVQHDLGLDLAKATVVTRFKIGKPTAKKLKGKGK